MVTILKDYYQIIDDNSVIESGSEEVIRPIWYMMLSGKYDFDNLTSPRKGDLRLIRVCEISR
jgi:hypothetical protein